MLVADGVSGSLLLAGLVAVAGADAEDDSGVTAGCSTWPLVCSGVGIAVGICDAPAAAADAEPFSVEIPQDLTPPLRCELVLVGGSLLPPSGAPDVSVGVGPDDPVGEVGV